ncbi:MAG: hypothetical protein ISS69_09755 [Phycisphaerae bacterium]|nr:hypothetical protein [Planctomycetota bacterium]MBL7220387.1 hypothetical protein [Phycisphaerae bacterium]
MRSATVVLIGCALLALVSPPEVRGAGAMRIDELKELVKVVEAEAEAWASSKRSGIKVTHQLRNVWYDKGSIGPLRTVLDENRKSPHDIFVANRLLSPMINAKPEVIAEAMGMIHAVSERLGKYETLPTYNEEEIKGLQLADDAPKDLRDRVEKRRAEKRKKELEVQKHNQQARALRAVVYRLMIRARTDEEDARLLKALVVSEKNGDWMYADILEAIRSQARRMKEPRAKVVYEALRSFWNDLRAAGGGSRNYVDQGSVKIVPLANSEYTTHPDVAKNRTLIVINQVASASRMPALRDPKAIKKPKKKPPTRKTRPRRTKK